MTFPVVECEPVRLPTLAGHDDELWDALIGLSARHSRSVPQLHPTISSMGLATAPYTEHTGPQRGNVSQEENTMTNRAGYVPGSNHPAGSDFSYAAGGMRGE